MLIRKFYYHQEYVFMDAKIDSLMKILFTKLIIFIIKTVFI